MIEEELGDEEHPAMQVGFSMPRAPDYTTLAGVFEATSIEDEQANFVDELIKESTVACKAATVCG